MQKSLPRSKMTCLPSKMPKHGIEPWTSSCRRGVRVMRSTTELFRLMGLGESKRSIMYWIYSTRQLGSFPEADSFRRHERGGVCCLSTRSVVHRRFKKPLQTTLDKEQGAGVLFPFKSIDLTPNLRPLHRSQLQLSPTQPPLLTKHSPPLPIWPALPRLPVWR